MTPLERITERIGRYGDVNDPTTPRPLLTLAEFFDGNEVIGSIGCNLIPTPTPAQFYRLFMQIATRQDVADIRVQVTMFDAPEWPFSDIVWLITSAAPIDVIQWFDNSLRPDECRAGWLMDVAVEHCAVPEGMQPICCWWN